jgi:glycosyltransferase involved in cell wall biosynthesis
MLLTALASVSSEVEFELRVVGDGPQRERWHRLVREHRLEDRVTWTGWLSHRETLAQYAWADLFAFTSLRDTSGNVVFEALSNGVPVIAPNHQGAGDILTPESGISIDVAATNEMVADYRRAILEVATNSERRLQLREGAMRRARDYAWDLQGRRMRDHYRHVLGGGFDWSDRTGPRPTDETVPDDFQNQEVPV